MRRCSSSMSFGQSSGYAQRGFGQQQPTIEGNLDSFYPESTDTAKTYPSARAAPQVRQTSTIMQSGVAARYETPFPEEISQNYDSLALFPGVASAPFPPEISSVLQSPLNAEDIEIKPDGAIYLPECQYRRILTRAFGAGGWAMVPRSAHTLAAATGFGSTLSREYALFCHGRYVSQARGHATIGSFSNPALASEVARSNALMRLCKDLGIGSELFDQGFVQSWKQTYATRRVDNGKQRWAKNNSDF